LDLQRSGTDQAVARGEKCNAKQKSESTVQRERRMRRTSAHNCGCCFYRPLVPNCWKNSSETGLV
jgi:hypothetical protein